MSAIATPEHACRPPQSRKKHQAILDAATKAFLKAGYGAATMDDIAAQARVSKQTIYHHFRNKEMLFAAIIEARSERFLAPIAHAELEPGDLAESLRMLGKDFLGRVLSPESLALHRVIVAESNRFPELGQLSYESGPRRIQTRLARFLSAQARSNGLSISDPETSAEQFFGALLGFLQLRAILCNDAESSAARIDSYVDHAVAVFLEGQRSA